MARARDHLADYRRKRDFRHTPEPRGGARPKSGHLYVIQKHDASRLHYDFRLQLNGVLKSWAVPKGPSMDPGEKRLAVMTEDHPVEYGTFEGVIEEGYGAGTVMLWDRGSWTPKGDAEDGLAKGHLKFTLKGERLKGAFALVRMTGERNKGKENWLLIKERDDEASEDDPLEDWPDSVSTGRAMAEIARGPAVWKAGAGKTERPRFVAPELATLRQDPPEGAGWLHEIKYDGYRIIALIETGHARLITRNEKDWTERFRPVATALGRLKVDEAVLDGELVALDGKGRSDFGLLGRYAETGKGQLYYYVFDLLHLDGEDWRTRPLSERKARLERLMKGLKRPLRFSHHIEGAGDHVIATACKMNLEGIVSKKASSKYRSGRGVDWIKSKCIGRDEFVIGGYRRSDKKGRPFASLLLGEYVDGALNYRGRVGTGFDEALFDDLGPKLEHSARKTSPFAATPPEARRQVVWTQPRYVAEVAYTERTADGRLRHPSFLGLREDKEARQVTAKPDKAEFCGVTLTHPDKVMFEGQKVTKRVIASYYATHAARILPFLAGRPVSLLRCPEGEGQSCFFQKHHNASIPNVLEAIEIAEVKGRKQPYILITNAAGLVAATQIGTLELHIWGARADKLERPERIVFDLDPDPLVPFSRVRDAAGEVRDRLEALGLRSFPLLTGGKGIHVVAPITRRRGWDEVKQFCRGLARRMAEEDAGAYVATASKEKREGRIFIDWLRNGRGSTAIAPYSLRAHEGAPVAVPVSWTELQGIERSAAFRLADMDARFKAPDPWRDYAGVRQSITGQALSQVT
jgi:bifunctional non-homologous end joining protein LigD